MKNIKVTNSLWIHITFQYIQAIYYTLALLNDFIGSNEPTPKVRPFIRKVRDYIFGSLAFPLVFDVGGMFWLLYVIDRELVLPKAIDAFFPWWLNHAVHTNIMAFALIEMFLLHHKYPARNSALLGLLIFVFAYLAWIHVVYYNTNIWVYPVLNVLNWPQRILFYIFTAAVPVFFYYIGEFLNNVVWGKNRVGGETARKGGSKKSKSKSKSKARWRNLCVLKTSIIKIDKI